MLEKSILTILLLVSFQSFSQTADKKVHYTFNLGIDFSIGKDKYVERFGTVNPTVIASYYAKKRFENSGLRIIGSIQLSAKDLYYGLQTGIIIHFNEFNPVRNYNQASFPVQLKVMNSLIKNRNRCILIEGAAGINFFYFSDFYYRIKSGPIASGGVQYLSNNRYAFRLGIDYQIDNGTYIIHESAAMNTKEELLKFKQKRSVIYATFGIKL